MSCGLNGRLWLHKKRENDNMTKPIPLPSLQVLLIATLLALLSRSPLDNQEESIVRHPMLQPSETIKVTNHSISIAWWRHEVETLSELLALWEGNPPVTGGFPLQRAFDVFFDVSLNGTVNRQSCRWIETPWRSRDVTIMIYYRLTWEDESANREVLLHVKRERVRVEKY